MLSVSIPPFWLEQARREASNLGVLNNSIRSGEGNVFGFLGEIVFCGVTTALIQRTYDYDVIYL